jgi:hypothetical protein
MVVGIYDPMSSKTLRCKGVGNKSCSIWTPWLNSNRVFSQGSKMGRQGSKAVDDLAIGFELGGVLDVSGI